MTRRWQDDAGIAAWSAGLRAHAALVRRIEADLDAAGGLSLGWYDVLLELSAAPPEGLRMGELGERAVLSRSRVSRIVDELVGAGLVRRRPDPADGRSSFVLATAAGRRALRRAAPIYLRSIERHFTSRLTAVELEVLRRTGERLGADVAPVRDPIRPASP